MMKLLCRKRHITIPDLAREFGVSTRTIQRDIDGLTYLCPIYVKAGRYEGGVYIGGDYTMDRMYMAPEEIQLLNKIKKYIENNITTTEFAMFEKIIKNYTKVDSYYYLKQDSGCPH